MNTKKSKLSSIHRLPSLYTQTLIKSESQYQREMRRKLDQLQHDNRDTIRRRIATDHLFAHEHLTKRYQWFHLDKSYRESCRTTWNKQGMEKNRTSHIILPSIFPKESTTSMRNIYKIEENDNPSISDEKIKQKFLYVQPVMLEVMNAPHSSKALKYKQHLELRKQSALQKQHRIQRNPMEDQRYRQLVCSLQDT